MGVDRVPLAVLIKKIGFHGEDSEVGDKNGMFEMRYKPRNFIKGQVLAYFVVEFTTPLPGSVGVCQIKVGQWKVFVDRASNAKGLGVEIVLVSLERIKLEKSLQLGFRASNIEAEYEALIAGLKAARNLGAKEVEIFLDSRLVVSQTEGSFEARDHRMS